MAPRPRPYTSLRMRADSNGSVRGAFGEATPTKPRKTSPKKKKNLDTMERGDFNAARSDFLKEEAAPARLSTIRDNSGEIMSYGSLLGSNAQSLGGNGQLLRTATPMPPKPPLPPSPSDDSYEFSDYSEAEEEYDDELYEKTTTERIANFLSVWLTNDLVLEEDGPHYRRTQWTFAHFVRHFFYNPLKPEFTSLQQFMWAVVLGIVMGVFTALWKFLIEAGIDFFWKDVPVFLLKIGFYTSIQGVFPIYHYMWMCPAVFGGILSWIFVILPVKIPDQNDWISSLHTRGVQDHRTFFSLFILSTFGMWSSLSLGPELPLVITSSMVGSWLAIICKQSMLSARVLNLTAASGAIGGFFGFPMAGALFCLELPHRMGLQYFEALSPATVSSIVAVLANRLVVNNDVTGYFSYPFLTSTLPSEIFTNAVIYGLYGAFIGILYVKIVVKFKTWVHDWFHAPHGHHEIEGEGLKSFDYSDDEIEGEKIPLVTKSIESGVIKEAPPQPPKTNPIDSLFSSMKKCMCFVIPDEPARAAVAGCLAGAMVGIIGIFVPHTLFWGEAQLQNLIDKGRTPLPVFGKGDEPTAPFTSLSLCMIDGNDRQAIKEGFSLGCSALIAVSKTVVIGLSLGTGIIGGHFWGPLFVGCAASHFLTDSVSMFASWTGVGWNLSAYPCVAILCTMGSAHVVSFRAIMAICLILTLTISAFNPEDEDVNSPFKVAGDYSAVFPLIVVATFTSLMLSRETIFYKTQRSRGDIQAVAEVLCEPNMAGRPMVHQFETSSDDSYSEGNPMETSFDPSLQGITRTIEDSLTAQEIEKQFDEAAASQYARSVPPEAQAYPNFGTGSDRSLKTSPPSSERLDELLGKPLESKRSINQAEGSRHRRTKSAPLDKPVAMAFDTSADVRQVISRRHGNRERSNSVSRRQSLVRVDSYGELNVHQPSLLDQARMRAASAADFQHRRVPSYHSASHSRHNSLSSQNTQSESALPPFGDGALSLEEVDRNFNLVVDSQLSLGGRSPWTDNSTS